MNDSNQTPSNGNQPETELNATLQTPDNQADVQDPKSMEEGAEAGPTVETLQEELNRVREDILRAHAEMQNIQRRADQEVEKARKFAVEKLVADMLPTVDTLEQTIGTIKDVSESSDAIMQGITLALKSFHDTLKKYGVEHLDPQGEPFNPNHHEAMAMIENPHAEHNTVLEVYRKGYLLNGRLVRPAMVVVNRHKQQ